MTSALLVALIVLSATLVAADGDWPGFPRKRSLENRDSTANANTLTDEILENVVTYMLNNDMEPLPLDDKLLYNATFEVLIATVRTRLGLFDGKVNNLTTLHRDGDTTLIYTSANRTLQLVTSVQFDKLLVDYKYAGQTLSIGPHGTLTAKITNLTASMTIDVALLSGKLSLQEFKLDTAKSIKIDVSGLSFLGNLIVEGFANFFTLLFNGPIIAVIQKKVEDAMTTAISSSPSVDTTALTASR